MRIWITAGTALLAGAIGAGIGLGAPAAEAAFPGENGKIVFDHCPETKVAIVPLTCRTATHIWTVNPDGSGQDRLTNDAGGHANPAFSADGRRIAFESQRGGSQSDIYVMSADGSGETRLTHDEEPDRDPAFSPDGKKIVYSASGAVWSMDAGDGSGKTRLTNFPIGHDHSAVYSPDGKQLAFVRSAGGRDQIWVMRADGSGKRNLSNNSADDFAPAFSPDGSTIVFGSTRDGDFEIYAMSADGSAQTNLTRTPGGYDGSPAFSPDGRQVVFTRLRDGLAIWVMNADGGDQRRLIAPEADPLALESSRERYPDWGPVPPGSPVTPSAAECSDGQDNDSDGKVDHPADPGCSEAGDDSEADPDPQCRDGDDNDGDGALDFPADQGCSSEDDNSESPDVPRVCEDGEDNDSDGEADYPADAGCDSKADASEGPEPPSGSSQRPYQPLAIGNPQVYFGSFADRGTGAGDLNGDGVDDLFVSGQGGQGDPLNFCSSVYALSGADQSVIYRIDPPTCVLGFNTMSSLGDIDGDDVPDVVFGTPSGAGNDRAAYVYSGKSGMLLHRLGNPDLEGSQGGTGGRFAARVGRAGDITGDGVPEVLVGDPAANAPAGCTSQDPDCREGQGRAYIFDVTRNPAEGKLLRTLELPSEAAAADANFGNAVQGPGDVDGDGTADQLVGANGANDGVGAMYLFSGKTGALLASIDSPDPQRGSLFGFQEAAPNAPGDVNADGHADLYAGAFDQHGADGKARAGRGWVFDGKKLVDGASSTDALLYDLRDPTPQRSGEFGWSMDKTDYDSDGTPDLYVGSAPHHDGFGDGGTYVYSGHDGSLLKALELPAVERERGATLGWFVAAFGDLNDDGHPDFAAGAPGLNNVYMFLSGPDPAPAASVNDVTVAEPKKGQTTTATFTVSLSAKSAKRVTIDFQTADGTATAGADYSATNGTLSFAAGETTKSVTVEVIGDNKKEASERFLLRLASPRNATLADAEGLATISDSKQ